MEDMEPVLLIEGFSREICPYLPKVVVDLVTALDPKHPSEPRRKANIMEMDVCGLVSTGDLLYAGLVGRVGDSPHFVEPTDLPQKIPTKEKDDAPVITTLSQNFLEGASKQQLMDACRVRGLKVSGKKSELINRINKYHA